MSDSTAEELVPIAIRDLSDRQLLMHVLTKQDVTISVLRTLEGQVATLNETVGELKAAIDGVAQRLLPKVAALEASLASTQTSLATALADDAAAAAVLAEATQATADIRLEIDRLNALGAAPETPVDPAPVDPIEPPAVDPTPVDPTTDPTQPAPPDIDPNPAPVDPPADPGFPDPGPITEPAPIDQPAVTPPESGIVFP